MKKTSQSSAPTERSAFPGSVSVPPVTSHTVLAAPDSAAKPVDPVGARVAAAEPVRTSAPVSPAPAAPSRPGPLREPFDRKKNLSYFAGPKQVVRLTFMAGGCLFAVIGAIFAFALSGVIRYVGFGLLGAGGAVFLIALICLVATAIRVPTDAQIDAVYRKLVDGAADAALDKAGVTGELRLETAPIVLGSCMYGDLSSKVLIRTGKDGVTRSSNFACFVLLFDAEQLLVYRNCYSLVRQEWQESLSEYYYRDIVLLSTGVDVFSDHKRLVRRETVHLETVSGSELDLPLEDSAASSDAIVFLRRALRAHKH